MITCRATGLVYRNPHPNLRAVHTWHPSIVRFDDGELVASFDLGQAVESLDYRTYLSRSTDDGKTWSEPAPLFQDIATQRTTHSVRLSRVADGTLVGFGGRFYRDNPDVGLVNHKNLGYVRMDLFLLQSRDRGRTWLGPTTIEPPLVGPSFEMCHSIRELADGRWLAPTSTWKGWNGDAPHGMNAIALVSHDRGRSWPEYLKIMSGYEAQGIVHWEQSLAQLPDGRLLSVAWALHEASGRTQPTPYAISEDGRTFGPPRPTGFLGQTAKILCLADGRILCVYRRDDRPGLWANLARIDGRDWVNLAEAPLWQGAGSGMKGRETPGEELSSLKFGYPTLTQLAGGDVLVLFWCNEECIHNIRWLRLAIG